MTTEITNSSRPPSTAPTTGRHLEATTLLDTQTASIRALVADRGWEQIEPMERIGAIYDFVRNEIDFGYNVDDDIVASRVLSDGYGQCNTKATLLMALLRAAGIPCRFHAATIHKRLQKGVVTGFFYRLAPGEIHHSWVEVLVDGDWKQLEGVILDDCYLDGLRSYRGDQKPALLGYAVGTNDLRDPPVEWTGDNTEIQMSGLARDLGTYDDPDAFYESIGTNLSGIKAALYRGLIRHIMNRKVATIRSTTE